jgi:hypothetical protein
MARYLTWSTVFMVLALGSSPALAHSWYPVSCCSEQDCRPLVEEKGETVTESTDGWRLWDGRIIARGIAKLSPDRQFHLCETRTKTILCFFAPPGGA